MRRRERMVHTIRMASANEGAGSSSVVSAPRSAARRSKCPRPGSTRRRPRTTSTRVGTANTRNGARQVKTDANPAPTSRPAMMPTLLAARWMAYTRGRLAMG